MSTSILTFARKIKGDIITSDHPEYSTAISRWAKNAERNAQLVVFVKDAQDVSLSLAYAKDNKLPIAVRGGGHNSGGASSAEGGLVIDLSCYLNHVRVDSDKKIGYVGGGAVWRDVDAEAIKHGLATVGGTINHTGVGGLTLGGGIGWLSGRHGLSLDNIKQVTIVTADGSILTANTTENADLFWAIRGGGGNFGVVTEFIFQLHPQRKTVFAGFIYFSPNKVDKLIEVTSKWWETAKEDEAMIQAAAVNPAGHPELGVCLFYNGPEEEGRIVFKEFLDIGPIRDLAKEIPYEKVNTLQNARVDYGNCYYLKGVSQRGPSAEVTLEALRNVAEIHTEGLFTPVTLFEYYPLAKVNAIPSSATAFRRKLEPNALIILIWKEDIGRVEKARQTANGMVAGLTRGLDAPEKTGYSNYAHFEGGAMNPERRSKDAFASNYPRLQGIKALYDPENTFNRWFPITPSA